MALPLETVDVLVLGTGMAGSTVAARAAQLGSRVLFVDAADRPGGSAALSGGNVWTTATLEEFLQEDPTGDVAKWQSIRAGIEPALTWLESLGARTAPVPPRVHDGAIGRHVDIVDYLARCRALVESSPGSSVALKTTARELLRDGDRVVGAIMCEGGVDVAEVHASAVVLATGGFQADPTLRNRHLFPGADRLLLRGSAANTGGGIELARRIGAGFTEDRRGFYGQLVPSPLASFGESEFRSLAMLFSVFGVLVNRHGERFVDESQGAHKNADAVGPLGTALFLIGSAMSAQASARGERDPLETLQLARQLGCRAAVHDSAAGLLPAIDAWGYPAGAVAATISDYDLAVRERPAVLKPPRTRFRLPLDVAPVWAVEVQAAVTFAYGGLLTDPDGRVMDEAGRVIPGLFAAGIDAAGPNASGYTGSLVRGLVVGKQVAEIVASQDQHETAPQRPGHADS